MEHDSPYVACKSQCRQSGWQAVWRLAHIACRDRAVALSWLRWRPRRRRRRRRRRWRCQQEVCKPKTEAPRFIIKIRIAQAAKRHITLKVHNTQTSVCVCVRVCVCVGVELICSLSGKSWQQIVRSNGKVSNALNCTFI